LLLAAAVAGEANLLGAVLAVIGLVLLEKVLVVALLLKIRFQFLLALHTQ
jgi:hypothetical protein